MKDNYRFISDIEPTDEQLAQLMREVGEDARARGKKANEQLQLQIRKEVQAAKTRYEASLQQ